MPGLSPSAAPGTRIPAAHWASSHLAAAQGAEHSPTGSHSQATHPSCALTPGRAGWGPCGTQQGAGRARGTQRRGQAAAHRAQLSNILGLMELLGNACPTAGSPWPQARIVSTLCSRECTLESTELSVQSPTSHFFCKACLESQCFMNRAPALPNGSEMGMGGSSEHLQAQLPGDVWGPWHGPAPSSAAQEAGSAVPWGG